MVNISSRPVTLSPEEARRLDEALAAESPKFVHAARGPLTVLLLEQPFFKRHKLLVAQSPMAFPAQQVHAVVSPFGEVHVLTGHLEHLQRAAENERPIGLDGDELARAYANVVDFWTTESELGELLVESFDDIPFFPHPTPVERARIDVARAKASARVQPPSLARIESGHLLTKWVVANKRLLKRELVVPVDGRVRRTDEIVLDELPVHAGN